MEDSFIEWLRLKNILLVVWDMDRTMSCGHCGTGLPLEKLEEYVNGASPDCIAAIRSICRANTGSSEDFQLAVATGSDPLEYDLPGQSRKSHILGTDLACRVLQSNCPECIESFKIMIGYDERLHRNEHIPSLNYAGKRHHMRVIQEFYNIPFERMVLFDDSDSSLSNEDGWIGIKVHGNYGFSFDDILKCPNKL